MSSPPFFLRDSSASETRARVKITQSEKRRHAAWGDFHARSRFARPTIPEEKWGTTRSLSVDHHTFLGNCLPYPSPKPTLTITPHLGQNVGLGEG